MFKLNVNLRSDNVDAVIYRCNHPIINKSGFITRNNRSKDECNNKRFDSYRINIYS